MTNVTFPRKEIEKRIKLTPEIIEKISLFGTPLEKIDSEEIEIEIFPNRPDLISLEGFLRAFEAFIGKNTGLKKYRLNKPEKNYIVSIDSSLKGIRPYTACVIVKNLSLDKTKVKTLIDLQEKLHLTLGRNRKKAAIGIYPLDKITFPVNYTAKKPGEIKFIPLGETKQMTATQILKKHSVGKEYSDLLKKEKLFPVFIDAKNKILSMPPIINSHETGRITEQTKNVFIECSGTDFETLKKIINIISTTMIEMGGKAYQINLQYEKEKKELTPDFKPEKIKINLEKINALLGLDLKEKDLEKLLGKMGHDYKNKTVFTPSWRTDILHEVDIAEDIAIAYGYDNLKPEIPKVATIAEESFERKINSKIADILTGLGLIEISSYHLIKPSEAKKMRLKKCFEVEDSKTEYKILRPNLLIPALRILAENKDNEYPQNIFEIGKIFLADKNSETGVKEPTHLIIALCPGNFTQIKQYLDYLMNNLALEYNLEEAIKEGLIEGRTAEIKFNDKYLGFMGELNPNTLKEWSIKMPFSVLEINLDKLDKELK